MATSKKTQIVITANAATAKKVMDELQQRIDQISAKMQSLDTTTKTGQREFRKLEKEIVSFNSAVAQNISNTERIDKAIENLSKTSLNDLKRALSAAKSELGKMSASSEGLGKMRDNVKKLQAQIDSLTESNKKQGGSWETAKRNLVAYVGMFTLFNKAKDLMQGAFRKNLEYSSSLTDIRKVSGLAMADVNQLSRELAKIDTRTSVDGLAQLAYQGAKLGMGKYGVDGMAGFVRAADQINVAIGEEMGEDALPALSKMVETMGLIPKMGIEKAMLATGSAMFKLSSTSTATSGNIVEFAKRLTGVSRTAGITTDQLLALGSASDSLFLMPEVSATAFSKFIVALQKNHNLIEKDLGIQQGTIKQMYAAGHAMDAIVLVLEKMRDKGNMNALGSIFKDLGSDGQRLVTAMVTMSKNVDVLKDHLYESSEAFAEASAVTAEYKMQQTSAMGIMERASNLWEKAFVNPDSVNNVQALAQAWYDMSHAILESPLLKGSLNASLLLVITSIKMAVGLLPFFINFALVRGLWSLVSVFVSMGKAIYGAVVAQRALNGAMAVNVWTGVVAVIMTVVGVLWSFANSAREAAAAQAEAERKANAWKSRLSEAAQETDTLTRKLDSYRRALSGVTLSQEERARQISKFNKEFRPYINKLGIEIKNVNDLRKNYQALSEEIQRATYYRLREQAKSDVMPDLQRDRLAAENKVRNLLKSYDGGFTSKQAKDLLDAGVGANTVFRKIIENQIFSYDPGSLKIDYRTGMFSYTRNGKLHTNHSRQYAGYGYVFKELPNKRQGQNGETFTDLDLLSALRYYQNSTKRERKKTQEIDDYFGDFVPDDYHPWVDDEVGTLENDAPDKKAIAAQKAEARDRARAWREELKQKQDEANAIMDNVRNFYERQVNAKLQQAVSLGMDKTEQDLFVEPVRRRMNQALEQVRLAIAGQENTWDEFKKTMSADLIEQADDTGVNLSEGLLQSITTNDIAALRSKLASLGESLKRPLNSIMAEIFAKATKNAQAVVSLEATQREARRKVAQEHDYTGIVQQKMYDDFNVMGFANPTSGEVSDEAAFARRKQLIADMFETARKGIVTLYTIDPSTEDGRGALLTFLFGSDPDGLGERIRQTLGDDAKEWQVFYQKLIQYNDEYETAQKKGDDERKKLTDYGWSKTDFYKAYQKSLPGMEQDVAINGDYRNAGQRMGMASISATDPELELLKVRMRFAQEYYQFLEKHNATEQQLAEARRNIMSEQANYAKKLTSDMFEQYNSLLTFMGPLQTFGESVGDAFATMTENASEGRKQLKSALKQMVKSFAANTLQMISQQQISRAQTTAHYTELLLMQQAFAQAQLQAEIANGVAMIGAQRATNLTEEQLEGIHQQVMAALRSAGIFGWCVSTLGPIAGPIAYSAMMATLMGLLNFAISKIGGSDNANNSNADKSKSTKVVSGMLTYDSGNVQDLKPFVGNDGGLYWAAEDNKPHDGVSLLTAPTATTINGRPSLVAERGPELVIGRETTHAMMMNNPALLKALVNYDRHYSGRRTLDRGNVSEAAGILLPGASAAGTSESNAALLMAVNTLLKRLNEPITAKVDMYGHGNLYESMTRANEFMKGK